MPTLTEGDIPTILEQFRTEAGYSDLTNPEHFQKMYDAFVRNEQDWTASRTNSAVLRKAYQRNKDEKTKHHSFMFENGVQEGGFSDIERKYYHINPMTGDLEFKRGTPEENMAAMSRDVEMDSIRKQVDDSAWYTQSALGLMEGLASPFRGLIDTVSFGHFDEIQSGLMSGIGLGVDDPQWGEMAKQSMREQSVWFQGTEFAGSVAGYIALTVATGGALSTLGKIGGVGAKVAGAIGAGRAATLGQAGASGLAAFAASELKDEDGTLNWKGKFYTGLLGGFGGDLAGQAATKLVGGMMRSTFQKTFNNYPSIFAASPKAKMLSARNVAMAFTNVMEQASNMGAQFGMDRAEAFANGQDFHYGQYFAMSGGMFGLMGLGGHARRQFKNRQAIKQQKAAGLEVPEGVTDPIQSAAVNIHKVLSADVDKTVAMDSIMEIKSKAGLSSEHFEAARYLAGRQFIPSETQLKGATENPSRMQNLIAADVNLANMPEAEFKRIMNDPELRDMLLEGDKDFVMNPTNDAKFVNPERLIGQEFKNPDDVPFDVPQVGEAAQVGIMRAEAQEGIRLRESLLERSNHLRRAQQYRRKADRLKGRLEKGPVEDITMYREELELMRNDPERLGNRKFVPGEIEDMSLMEQWMLAERQAMDSLGTADLILHEDILSSEFLQGQTFGPQSMPDIEATLAPLIHKARIEGKLDKAQRIADFHQQGFDVAVGPTLNGKPVIDMHFGAQITNNGDVAWQISKVKLTDEGQKVARALRDSRRESVSGDLTDADLKAVATFVYDQKITSPAYRKAWDAKYAQADKLKAAHKWLKQTDDWSKDPKGKLPPDAPKQLDGIDLTQARLMLRNVNEVAQERLLDASANKVATNSQLYAMLTSSDPAAVRKALAVAKDANTLIGSDIPIGRDTPPMLGTEAYRRASLQEDVQRKAQRLADEGGRAVPDDADLANATTSVAADVAKGKVAPNNSEAVAVESHLRALDIIDTIENSNIVGMRAVYDGSGGFVDLGPSAADKWGARQRFLSIKNILAGEVGIEMADQLQTQTRKYKQLIESDSEYMSANMSEYFDWLDRRRATFGDKVAELDQSRLLEAKETSLEAVQGLDPIEVSMTQALDAFWRSKAKALNALGIKTIDDGSYVTRILKSYEQLIPKHDLNTAEHARFRDIQTRFAKHRRMNGAERTELINDIGELLGTYTASVNRMIAFKPVTDTWRGLIEHHKVDPDSIPQGISRKEYAESIKKLAWTGVDIQFSEPGKGLKADTVSWLAAQSEKISGMPGSISKATEHYLNLALAKVPGNRQLDKVTAKGLIGDLTQIAYINGIGGPNNLGGVERNVISGLAIAGASSTTGNALTFTPKSIYNGVKVLFKRNTDGSVRMHEALREVLDGKFTEMAHISARKGLLGMIGKGLDRNFGRSQVDVLRKIPKMWTKLFEASEVIVRGGAFVTVYEDALQRMTQHNALGQGATLSMDEMHRRAVKAGRSAAEGTQVAYDGFAGAPMFGGTAGRAFGQFQRYGANVTDTMWAWTQKSGILHPFNKDARMEGQIRGSMRDTNMNRTLGIGKGDFHDAAAEGLKNYVVFAASLAAASGVASWMFGHSPKDDGILSATPEVVRYGVGKGIEGAASLLTDNPVDGVVAAEKIKDALGADTFSHTPIDAFMSSLSPTAGALTSLGQHWLGMSTMSDRDWAQLKDDFGIFTLTGGSAMQRMFRFSRELANGTIQSRKSGQTLVRDVTAFEAVQRMVGLDPTRIRDEMKDIGMTASIKEKWETQRDNINFEAANRLRNGEKPAEVLSHYIAAWGVVEHEWGIPQKTVDVAKRWQSVIRAAEQRDNSTLSARNLRELPMSVVNQLPSGVRERVTAERE